MPGTAWAPNKCHYGRMRLGWTFQLLSLDSPSSPDNCFPVLTMRELHLCLRILFLQLFSYWIWRLSILSHTPYLESGDRHTYRPHCWIHLHSQGWGWTEEVPSPLGPPGRHGAAGHRAGRRTEEGPAWRGSRLGGALQCLGRSCSLLRFPPDQ